MIFTQAQLDAMTDRPLSEVEYVIIHHTAANDMNEDILTISEQEMHDQGFLAVGYHFVIHGDGTIQVGRPIGKVPAAALGLNTVSVDIAFEGNFHPPDAGYTGEHPSPMQEKAVVALINNALIKKIPSLKFLIGHRDAARITNESANATACTGDLLYDLLPRFCMLTKLIPK